jgi:hypothetical protein
VCGLIALASAWLPSAACAQLASDFQPTFDSGARTAPGFQKQNQPVSNSPSRFGDVPGSKTTTVSDGKSAREGASKSASGGSKSAIDE